MTLFGSNSGLFTVLGFIVLLLGEKMKKEGRRDKKGKKGRGNKNRKKERREEGVKRKKNKPPTGFKLAKPVLLVFLAAAG